ncbi:hypothetical protein TGVAND_254910 [Toxoplasma gondii VAND]|uniref:Uncharacterized protein n=1 Tax=Toxoplasma gondii VAND TaxID=933077 RepID=A0A086Q2G1_TOXGO|nr:hypothetical protein TGVAND_254910 [Toxoplasma gondii VAND]
MSPNTTSLPQQGALLAGVAAAGPAPGLGRSVVSAGSTSRRTASASSFLSQRLGESFRFLPQSSAAATSKRTRQFLQTLASSSSLASHEGQAALTSAADSKAAVLSGVSASSLRSETCAVSDVRAAKQQKLVSRPCVAPVQANSQGAGDVFPSSAFAFGSNGPLGPQPEKITPPPLSFVPSVSRGRTQQAGGAPDSSFGVSKSVLSLTSRNVPAATRGSSPSPAAALLATVKPADSEKKGLEPADVQTENKAPNTAEAPHALAAPLRTRSEGACMGPKATGPLPARLDFLNLVDCCRLVMCDTADAFGEDFGVDNTHNSRLAQFSYDQAAYKADKAHPATDYTATSKRISPETRDSLMCILNQVAAHLTQNSSASNESQKPDSKKTTPGSDPLSPRAAATVAIAIQLFDRFMHVVHQNDLQYGLSAEHRMHPLHGLSALAGSSQRGGAMMNTLLLNQLIAITCFCFADRVEAIHAYDYSAVLEAWKQQATGLLRQSWTSSLLSATVLKQKLMQIERKIISHVPPAGNVSVTPISELTEALLNVAVQFAHVNERQRRPPLVLDTRTPRREDCEGSHDSQEAELASPGRVQSGASMSKFSPLDPRRRASVSGEVGRESEAKKDPHRLSLSGRETAASSRRCSAVSLCGDAEGGDEASATRSLSPSSPFALRLRISGSNEPDMARLIAQLLVRLGQLDRRICLGFKPSIVASAACQIALLPQLSATEISPLSPAGRLAATRAFIASGASTGCRLVRRCQSMLLHKWLKVRNAMDTLLSSSGYSGAGLSSQGLKSAATGLSGSGCSLPDRMAAEWVLSRLTLPSHKKVLELLQFHAEIWAECAAANLKAKALAVGAPATFIEAVTGAMGAKNARRGREERDERDEEALGERRRTRSLQARTCGRDPARGPEERALPPRAPGLSTSLGLYAITALQKELKRAERASIEGRRMRNVSPEPEKNANQENRENL